MLFLSVIQTIPGSWHHLSIFREDFAFMRITWQLANPLVTKLQTMGEKKKTKKHLLDWRCYKSPCSTHGPSTQLHFHKQKWIAFTAMTPFAHMGTRPYYCPNKHPGKLTLQSVLLRLLPLQHTFFGGFFLFEIKINIET